MKTNKSIWEILVPTMMKGKPVRTRHHKEWDRKVKNISGGLTITPPSKGYWVNDSGETIKERMIPVKIFCTESEIRTISNITAMHYKQDAIMFYKAALERKRLKHRVSKKLVRQNIKELEEKLRQ